MGLDKHISQMGGSNKPQYGNIVRNRTIFYGEVINISDETDGGRIQVRIPELDNRTADEDLIWSYPLLPKFFHIYPQVGEMVRIFIEDNKFPQRSRFWMGSIISQQQKIGFDSKFTALSTTNLGLTSPDKAISTFSDAEGVFPLINDIAIIGKVNTDIILKVNEVHIRAGKHENDDVYKLNKLNPASISMVYEPVIDSDCYQSNTIVMSDKIALITHGGNPKFKSAKITSEDRERIFDQGHPVARADVLIEALEIIRQALINHIHGYSGISSDKTDIINKLEKLQFEQILQKNIVIN